MTNYSKSIVIFGRLLNYLGNNTPEDAWDCFDEQWAAYKGMYDLHLLPIIKPRAHSVYFPDICKYGGPAMEDCMLLVLAQGYDATMIMEASREDAAALVESHKGKDNGRKTKLQ